MNIKEQIPQNEKCWYAVQCKYRCEKNLMQEFLSRGIEAYVPIQKKMRQYKFVKKKSETVLIPSHIFVLIDQSEYLSVLKHPHVFRFLNFSGAINAIPAYEVDLMKRVVGENDIVTIVEANYQVGDHVEIINGEMTGLTGILIEEKNHNFKIELVSLGWGMMIYVDPKYLSKIQSKRRVA